MVIAQDLSCEMRKNAVEILEKAGLQDASRVLLTAF